jgi:hypothetical protein
MRPGAFLVSLAVAGRGKRMQMGMAVAPALDGRHYVTLNVIEGPVNVNVVLTDEDNYEHDIDELIRGLKGLKADMRRAKSGLVIAQEVPNGLSRNKKSG